MSIEVPAAELQTEATRRPTLPPSRVRPAFLLLGLLLLLVFGWRLATPRGDASISDLLGLLVAGICLAVALGSTPPRVFHVAARAATARSQWTAGGVLVLLGAVGSAAAAQHLWVSNLVDWQPVVPFWLAGMLLPILGAWLWDGHPVPRLCRELAIPALAAIAIGALAVALRVYRIGQVPPSLFIDETNGIMDALGILRGSHISPFTTGWYDTPNGYEYLQAPVIALLGPTVASLKVPGITASALTVVGVFLLGRRLFGTPTGIAAGALMAVAHWSINMSRWGWNENFPPLFHVWTAYLLVRAAQQRRKIDFALAGLALGLGMYTYLSIRLVAAAIGAYLLYRMVVDRGFLRHNVVGLLLFGLLFTATAGPLLTTYARHPETFSSRMDQVTIQHDVAAAGGSLQPVWDNLKRHLLMFNVQGDLNGRHNIPGQPMLDPLLGALFVAGFARGILLLRDHRYGLLITWIPVVLLGGILSALSEGPQSYRTLGTLPALVLLSADLLIGGSVALARLLSQVRLPLPVVRFAAAGIPAAVVAVAAVSNFQWYFGAYAANPTVYASFNSGETAVAFDMAAAPDPSIYYLEPQLYYYSSVKYFTSATPDHTIRPNADPPYHIFQGLDDLPIQGNPEQGAVILLEPAWSAVADAVKVLYPSARVETLSGARDEPLYVRVSISADDIKALSGLQLSHSNVGGSPSVAHVQDPTATLVDTSSQVTWQGSLYIPESGQRTIAAPAGTSVMLDAKPLAAGAFFIAKGLHALVVQQNGTDAATGLHLTWTTGVGPGGLQPIPASAYFVRGISDAGQGLTGTYFSGSNWQGQPLFQRLDPLILFAWPQPEPVSGEFSVRWQGTLQAPANGAYRFFVQADDGARLEIDGKVIGEGLTPNNANTFEAPVNLTAGPHAIQLDYFQIGGAKTIVLRWTTPAGGIAAPIPMQDLRPS